MVLGVKIYYSRCMSCRKCVVTCALVVLEWFEASHRQKSKQLLDMFGVRNNSVQLM